MILKSTIDKSSTTKIKTADMPNGIYLVQIFVSGNIENKMSTKKVIVNH